MKIRLELNDKAKSGIGKSFLLRIAKEILAEQSFSPLKNKNITASFAFVDEKEIAKINNLYRHKKSPTDVLSFAEYKNQKKLFETGDKNVFLGEVILCYNYIKKQAGKNGMKQELAEIVSHGLLHLLGLRHSKKMFAIQKKVSKNF